MQVDSEPLLGGERLEVKVDADAEDWESSRQSQHSGCLRRFHKLESKCVLLDTRGGNTAGARADVMLVGFFSLVAHQQRPSSSLSPPRQVLWPCVCVASYLIYLQQQAHCRPKRSTLGF